MKYMDKPALNDQTRESQLASSLRLPAGALLLLAFLPVVLE